MSVPPRIRRASWSRPSRSGPGRPRLEEDETLGPALEAGGEPRIFRLLRGDRQAMTALVAALADDDRTPTPSGAGSSR